MIVVAGIRECGKLNIPMHQYDSELEFGNHMYECNRMRFNDDFEL